MLSEKRDVPYYKMIGWIRCRMSFSLVRASVMSIRGARSSANKGALHEPIDLQAAEGQPSHRLTTTTPKILTLYIVNCDFY